MILLITLMIIWVALTGELTLENFGFSFFLSWLILFVSGRNMQVRYFAFGRRSKASKTGKNPVVYYAGRIWIVIRFIGFFLIELVRAGATVFISILAPKTLRPGVVAVPLDLKTNAEITLLANLITLTPGTLSLDVSTDKRVIYVHTVRMDDPESFRAEIKEGFEKRVMEVMRP